MTLTDYAVIDIETTGLDPYNDHIIELAWVIVEGGKIACQESRLVDPGVPLPAVITDLTGITPAMLFGMPSIGGILDELSHGVITDIPILGDPPPKKLPVVGHNLVRFDGPFINVEGQRCGWPRFLDAYNCIDTAALFKGYTLRQYPYTSESHLDYAVRILDTWTKGLKYNLPYACASMGVHVADVTAHRALGDALMTMRLFEAMQATGIEIGVLG